MMKLYWTIGIGCLALCGLGLVIPLLGLIEGVSSEERVLRMIANGLYLLIAVVCLGNVDRLMIEKRR